MRREEIDISLEFCEQQMIPAIVAIVDKHIDETYSVAQKGQGNFVTTIDYVIEKELIAMLLEKYPMTGILAEECGEDLKAGYNWIIDPIDGTNNFMNGLQYATSVALVHGTEVLLGFVYNPKDKMIFYGCRGQGSFCLSKDIKTRLQMGNFTEREGISIIGMPYDRKKTGRILTLAEKIYEYSSDLKRIGPSSLDICMVASGQAKLYAELDLKPWDISAGILILQEAGGDFLQQEDLFLFGKKDICEMVLKTL